MGKKKLRRVLVKWMDVESDSHWCNAEDISKYKKKKFPVADSVGYIMYEDDRVVAIASCVFQDDRVHGNRTFIPRALVLSIENI